MHIRLNDKHAIKNIAHFANVRFVPGEGHCIAAYDERDVLAGGVLFTDWNNMGSVQMHMALFGGTGGMRPLLYLVYQYPFEQLKVKKVFGLVPEFNVRARNMNLHMGFRIEYLVADVFASPYEGSPTGMYIMSMTRDECRWLNMKPPIINYAPTELTDPMRDRAQQLFDMPAYGPTQ